MCMVRQDGEEPEYLGGGQGARCGGASRARRDGLNSPCEVRRVRRSRCNIAVVEGVQSFSPIWLAGRPSWELPYRLGHTYI